MSEPAEGAGAAITNTVHWRCFHCNEVFYEESAARLHFGSSEMGDPACQVDAATLRSLEAELAGYREEDTELHRALAAKVSEMGLAVRRAEELGYARGLEDAKRFPEAL